jgi:hypothetical protein
VRGQSIICHPEKYWTAKASKKKFTRRNKTAL